MRHIPVNELVVVITAAEVRRHRSVHWRGRWSVYPGAGSELGSVAPALAQGETDLYLSEENAYLFAGTEGVAVARKLGVGPS